MRGNMKFIFGIVVGVCCGIALFMLVIQTKPNQAWASSLAKYDYFAFTLGQCQLRSGSPYGIGAIDLRSGNYWCVPYDGRASEFVGTLNLSAIPEQAPKK